ncbi:MAG TPA: hypothetical protein VI136_19320 [Verrucomicrobiae bacterium]
MNCVRSCGARFAALALALVVSVAPSSLVTAQGSNAPVPADPSATNRVVASLTCQEVSHTILTWGVSVQNQTAPFAKEPSLAAGKIQRGRLDFRPRREPALGFIWDPPQAKLYLDINGNDDLTDDTNGVFTCRTKSSDERYQLFTDIRLAAQTNPAASPLLLDLNFRQYSSLYVSASLRSFYAGKTTLADRDWQVGIIEKPYSDPNSLRDASLLFRSWDSRTQAFGADDGRLQAFPLPKTLCFGGHSYRVTATWESATEAKGVRLEFAEEPVPLGGLKINGDYIRRALLMDASRTVVLDAPTGTVPVPVGSYTSYQVHLQQSESSASLKDSFSHRGVTSTITVQSNKPGTLVAGGPLTNTVTLRRRGNLLVMEHRVVGAGGEAYQLDGGANYEHPPTFAVFSGEKRLATGKFEFG